MKVPIPRIKMRESSFPGCPETILVITPDIRPAIALLRLAEALCFSSSAFTVEIAPTTETFFCVPYPTTTTSSSSESFAFILTVNEVWLFIFIS